MRKNKVGGVFVRPAFGPCMAVCETKNVNNAKVSDQFSVWAPGQKAQITRAFLFLSLS